MEFFLNISFLGRPTVVQYVPAEHYPKLRI